MCFFAILKDLIESLRIFSTDALID